LFLSRENGIPLYVQARESLREELSAMRPGEAIPTEGALEKRFGVSRITVRKAIDALTAEGLLVRQQGKGTFVQRPKLTHELSNITSWTEQLEALGYEPYTKHAESEEVAPPSRVLHMLQLEEGPVVRLRRLRLAGDEPVSIMVNYLPKTLVPGLTESGLRYESLYEELEKRYGLVPATSVDTVEVREADEQEAELLEIQSRTPVIFVTRVSFLEDGSPLEVALATSRGDRYQYRVALSGRANLPDRRPTSTPDA